MRMLLEHRLQDLKKFGVFSEGIGSRRESGCCANYEVRCGWIGSEEGEEI